MKKRSAVIFILLLLAAGHKSRSQSINNQFQLAGELAMPINDYRTGWGAHLKWLRRLGPSGELTISAGMSRFSASDKPVDGKRASLHLIPFLAGYRHNFDGFFIEPQAGYGELGGKVDIGGDVARPSVGAFVWALNAGYKLKRVDIGLRYQGAHAAQTRDAGMYYNAQLKYIGIFAAYNLRKALK